MIRGAVKGAPSWRGAGNREAAAGAARGRRVAPGAAGLVGFVGVAVLAACADPGGSPADGVRVSAAVSLTEPLERVAESFEADTGTAVELNLAGSSTLAAQILAGAPVDIFVSADERQMDRVAAESLVVAETRVVLLSNRLAVVVPAGADAAPRDAAGLRDPVFRRIAVGDPAGVPAGVYARAYLASLGLWDALAPRLVPTRSVRSALAVVEAGDADAGIVYRTDALSSDEVAVAFEVPEDEGPAIAYPAAVLVDAPNPAGAARFLDYLLSMVARRAFGQAGFIVPRPAPASRATASSTTPPPSFPFAMAEAAVVGDEAAGP